MIDKNFIKRFTAQAMAEKEATRIATEKAIELQDMVESVKYDATADELRVLRDITGPGMVRYRLSQYIHDKEEG